jgi:hypothetical protein
MSALHPHGLDTNMAMDLDRMVTYRKESVEDEKECSLRIASILVLVMSQGVVCSRKHSH